MEAGCTAPSLWGAAVTLAASMFCLIALWRRVSRQALAGLARANPKQGLDDRTHALRHLRRRHKECVKKARKALNRTDQRFYIDEARCLEHTLQWLRAR
jgi:hypothetical protein